MSESKLDEAVEVACREFYGVPEGRFHDDELQEMRAALLAGVKVLMGEPVAWQRRIRGDSGNWSAWTDWENLYGEGMKPKIGRWDAEYRPVYAPSLGEGDGR